VYFFFTTDFTTYFYRFDKIGLLSTEILQREREILLFSNMEILRYLVIGVININVSFMFKVVKNTVFCIYSAWPLLSQKATDPSDTSSIKTTNCQ